MCFTLLAATYDWKTTKKEDGGNNNVPDIPDDISTSNPIGDGISDNKPKVSVECGELEIIGVELDQSFDYSNYDSYVAKIAGFNYGNKIKNYLISYSNKHGSFTQASSKYLKYSKGLGYAATAITTGYSFYKAGNYYYSGGTDWKVAAKPMLDATMAAIGIWGGPIGFSISMSYFLIDYATDGFGGFGEIKNN